MRWSSEFDTRSLALSAALLLLLLAAAMVAADATSPTAEIEGVAVPEALIPDLGEPDDEGFFVDDERGRFKIEKVPNLEGSYRWVDEKTIIVSYGLPIDIVQHDEEWLWIKIWDSTRRTAPQQGPTPEEAAARNAEIAASYEFDTAASDRLRFESFDNGLPQSGQWRQGFDVADMNGDGHIDIVFGPRRKDMSPLPNIFLGDGEGNWARWRTAFPRAPYDYGDAAAGDLNGDGRMDLVLGIHLRGILALVSEGDGRFALWTEGIELDQPGKRRSGSAFSSRAIELFDWNRDGRLDIIALGEGPKGRTQGPKGEVQGQIVNRARGLLVYLNNGDGTWTPKFPGEWGWMSFHFGDDFALADFDADGDVDIALATRAMSRKSIIGNAAEDGSWSTAVVDSLRNKAFLGAVAAADVDGDGAPELFVGYSSRDEDRVSRTGIDIYVAGSDLGEWQRRTLFAAEGRHGVYSIDTGDLDGDGNVDLVAVTGQAEVWVFLGDGKGGFAHEATPETPAVTQGCRGYGVRLVDLDAEAGDEIVVAYAGEEAGYPGISELFHPGCPRQGSIRVWKAVAVTGEPPAAGGDVGESR
ncbi:MAG: VCBS repeat-containing protein [Thermoanaerobaculia bacterium]